jgi:hypothetical protein
MKAIGQFFVRLKDSFYNPAAYAAVRNSHLGHRLLFLFLVLLLLSVLTVGQLMFAMVPAVSEIAKEDYVSRYYPDGLEVIFADGKASTNVEEPFLVPIPEEERQGENAEFDTYLAIDTRPDVDIETLSSYKAMILLTQQHIFVQGGNNDRIIPLTGFDDLTLTEELVHEWSGILVTWFSILAIPFALLAIVFVAVFGTVFHALLSLAGALLVRLAGFFKKENLSYGQAYSIALFATVPVAIIQTAAYFAGVPAIPYFLDVALFFVIVLVNIKKSA